jgi:fructokinase
VGNIERVVGIGQCESVAEVELQADRCGDGRTRRDSGCEDFRPVVDADDRQRATPSLRPDKERHRDVRTAGPDVEEREPLAMGGQCVDRVRAQTYAAEPPIDPAEVAEVRREGRRIVQGAVEHLGRVDAALHRPSVRPAGTMGHMIVIAGEALIDIIVDRDGGLRSAPGGGPFNTARTIGRLGGAVAILGRLSRDRFGGVLREALEESDVDLSMTESTDAPTTLAIAELDDDGVASYRFHTSETSSADLSPDAIEAALSTRPRAVHLGTLGLVLEPAAERLASEIAAVGLGTLVMLAPNCRPRAIRDRVAYLDRLERLEARADIVTVSVDDLAYLSPDRSPAAAARAILDRGPAVVLVTDGPDPVRIVTPTVVAEVVVPAVSIVDTVGAGDAFGGGFLARWIERGAGRDELADLAALRDAVAFGVAVAVRTCQRPGADPPRRAELERARA